MEMPILSKERITAICSDTDVPYGTRVSMSAMPAFVAVAKAQHKEDLRWFAKWGEEDCPHEWIDFHTGEKLPTRNKKHCPKCWQELKELAELEGES